MHKADQLNRHGVEYFDALSSEWDESERRKELARHVIESLLEAVPNNGYERVMELGCGTGLVTAALAPYFSAVLAVDSSSGMLGVLAQKLGRLGLGNVQLMNTDFVHQLPKGPFDLIVSSMTLHHVEDVQALFAQAFDQVVPGGYVAFADLEEEDGSFHGPEVPTVRHQGFNPSDLKQWLENCRFCSVKVRRIHTITKQEPYNNALREYPVLLTTARRAPEAS